jgi:hypothetical protein
MPSSVVDAYQLAIRAKQTVRKGPNLALVAHCIAQALALTPAELASVTAGVRAGIARGALKVSVPHDDAGSIDETKLAPLPRLPPTADHPQRAGDEVSERLVSRLVATCGTLTPLELTLVTQGVRAGVAARG